MILKLSSRALCPGPIAQTAVRLKIGSLFQRNPFARTRGPMGPGDKPRDDSVPEVAR
jgi:hypothetical protein